MKIKTYNNEIKNFNGLLFLDVANTTNFLKEMFIYEKQKEDASIEINNKNIWLSECVIISPLTKYSDLFAFNSKNVITKLLSIINIDYANILNIDYISNNILHEINQNFNNDIVSVDNSSIKIIKSLINISDDFISEDDVLNYLNLLQYENEPKTIILKDFNNLKLFELSNYITINNIIVLKNDIIYDLKNNFELFEAYALVDEQNSRIIKIESIDGFEYFLEELFEKEISDDILVNMSDKEMHKIKLSLKNNIF
ncbi:hypothetical protein ACNQ17_00815 [Mycoplasma sp. Sp48II]|uniref:hypothetical protein n=1 Tax=unclassified Mycoplasma TaxID=2683645 RepID=UPI003AAD216E